MATRHVYCDAISSTSAGVGGSGSRPRQVIDSEDDDVDVEEFVASGSDEAELDFSEQE